MNPTLHTAGNASVLRFERRLPHPVEKVWRAVTEPGHLAHWFPSAVELDPRPGGVIRFVHRGVDLPPDEGQVLEFDPPRVFAFTWGGDPLRWELRPDGAGCLLVFTHTVTDRPMAGSFAAGWETCLGALSAALEGRPAPMPPVPENYAGRHDAYLAAFGLDEGTVREDPGGWTIRFERLLPHPVEEVWPALAGAGAVRAGDPAPPEATVAPVQAGPLTEADARRLLEYGLAAGGTAGRVRWELTGGHPAGTRVVLTQTGPAGTGTERPALLAAWHARLDSLAARLRGAPPAPDGARAEELARRYAAGADAR